MSNQSPRFISAAISLFFAIFYLSIHHYEKIFTIFNTISKICSLCSCNNNGFFQDGSQCDRSSENPHFCPAVQAVMLHESKKHIYQIQGMHLNDFFVSNKFIWIHALIKLKRANVYCQCLLIFFIPNIFR